MKNERLLEIRGELTQPEFAKRLGVHRNTVARYENGVREPDGPYLRALAELGWNPLWVLTGEGSREISPDASPGMAVDTALVVARGDSSADARRSSNIVTYARGLEEAQSQAKRSKGEMLTTATKLLEWAFGMQGVAFDSVRDADLLAKTYEFLAEYDGPDNIVAIGTWLAARVRAKETDDVQGKGGRSGGGDR